MREQFGNLGPRLSMLREFERRRQEAADLIRKFNLIDDIPGSGGARKLAEHWLGIKQVHLTRAAVHEEMNNCLGFGLKVRRLGLQIIESTTFYTCGECGIA